MMMSVVVMLGSCKKDGDDGENTTVTTAQGEDGDLYSDLPTGSYEDYEFNILSATSNYGLYQLDATDTSTKITEAIYNRNRYIEQQLSMVFKVKEEGMGNVTTEISKLVNAGTHAYDLCYNESHVQVPLVSQGIYIEQGSYAKYVNFEKPWWYKDSMDSLTIADRNFFLIGDSQMWWNDSTSCIAFNKDILSQYDTEDPYKLVKDGKWTLEELYKMIQTTKVEDDNNRRWGVTGYKYTPSVLLMGAGVELIKKDASGNSTLITAQDGNVTTIYSDIIKYFYASNGDKGDNWLKPDADTPSSKKWQDQFTEGNVTFMIGTVGDMRLYLPKSEIEYGIVPVPKHNAELQSKYVGYVYEGGAIAGIPMSIESEENLERACTIIEWMGAMSYKMLKPVYYDEIIKARTANDPESAEMLDIVFGYNELGSKAVELDVIFKFGVSTAVCESIFAASDGAISGILSSKRIGVNMLLDKTITNFKNFGDYDA